MFGNEELRWAFLTPTYSRRSREGCQNAGEPALRLKERHIRVSMVLR